MSAVLFVLTSNDRMSNGDPTGVWLEEYAVPWMRLTEAGHEVTVASVAGGDVPVDPNSEPNEEQAREWSEAIRRLRGTPALDTCSADDFDAVYLPGGHGTMFDLPDNQQLHELLLRFDEQGKVIACVCHAPAVFSGMQRRDGQPFVAGRRVTAFTDSEERAVGGEEKIPFMLEGRLRELGADVSTGGDWASHVVVDGRLITGQNPQSSEAVAGKLLTTLA